MGNPKVRVWTIIGDSHTGKSTTVGHLTYQFGKGVNGLRNNGPDNCKVQLRGGGLLSVYSWRSALQESSISPQKFLREVSTKAKRLAKQNPHIALNNLNILIPLRFDAINRCPAGHEYLSYFVSEDWTIESLVLLGDANAAREQRYYDFGVPTCNVPRRVAPHPTVSIGWTVGIVRNHFEWA